MVNCQVFLKRQYANEVEKLTNSESCYDKCQPQKMEGADQLEKPRGIALSSGLVEETGGHHWPIGIVRQDPRPFRKPEWFCGGKIFFHKKIILSKAKDNQG